MIRHPVSIPTNDWLDFAIIATDRLDIGGNLNIAGNFATTAVGGTLEIGVNTFQLDDSPPPFVTADTLRLSGQASVANAYTNDIVGSPNGEVRGTVEPQQFPLDIDVPTFPTAEVCDACTLSAPDVVVDPDDTITLTPGCYGELFARMNAAVFLEPGSYNFFEWDIQKFASVTANGPVQIYIRDKIGTEEENYLGAASAEITDFQVWIGARKTCSPMQSVRHTMIGKFSVVIGTFVAPDDDDFNFNRGAILMGTTVAEQVCVRGEHSDRPPTPTPIPTGVPTPTPTPPPSTPTPSPTMTPGLTPTPTPTPEHLPTPTPTSTPSATPTPTPTPENIPTPSPTPTATPASTPTPTPSPTPVFPTPTPSPTPGTTPTPGMTPTPMPTPTPTLTPTPLPTVVPPPTATPVPRKKPWGRKSGLIEPLFPTRTGPGIAPSVKRPIGVRRR